MVYDQMQQNSCKTPDTVPLIMNLQALIEQYNALVQKLCATLNNLDEENFSDAVRQKGESDNE